MGNIELSVRSPDWLVIRLSGDWLISAGLPSAAPVRTAISSLGGKPRVSFEADTLGAWDSALVTFLLKLTVITEETGAHPDFASLPEGVRRLVQLATAVPERKDAARGGKKRSIVDRIGAATIGFADSALNVVRFIGEVTIAFGTLFRGRARFRGSDLLQFMQECGAQALGIVTIVSFLIGLILAFVGAVQLKQFGADIFVANLVSVAMFREMAAVMTAIVLTGRTGAAFAAHIGTMQVNEEIDALQTLGIPPIEFLVLPRILALMLMTPLLCVYSNLMGLIGGYAVAINMLNNVTTQGYLLQTQGSVTLTDFSIGIAKSAVFGLIIAVAGCLKGIQCGRSAEAVGQATTAAVVAGILFIIIADGTFAVILNVLGI